MLKLSISSILFTALVAACASGPSTSTKGQLITCETDPGNGVILSCAPGDGGGGENSCQDIDDDGDGEPHDEGDDQAPIAFDPNDDDDDDDGISNDDDCDEGGGGDGDDDCDDESTAELPYAIEPQLGATTTPIVDAFAEKGMQPAEILSVDMDGGGSWRITELKAGTAFVVTEDDCNHDGNRDVGRDRVLVTWRNTDNSTETDHLDIRYCEQ